MADMAGFWHRSQRVLPFVCLGRRAICVLLLFTLILCVSVFIIRLLAFDILPTRLWACIREEVLF